MKNLSEINTVSQEGKLLMTALAALTVSPQVQINGEMVNGSFMTPDEMLHELEDAAKDVFQDYDTQHLQFQEPESFVDKISSVINQHSKENCSNTPDFVLANYLNDCLEAFNKASNAREKWFGKNLSIISVAQQ